MGKVDDIEAKLDQLIDVYMEDRKRLLSQPQYHVPSNPAIPPLNLNQWNPAGIRPEQKASDAPVSTTSQSPCIGAPVLSWPKPILVDKQSSEPNTPIAKNFDRPTQCATSQMGHRMKKRVTLSSIPQCTPSFLDDSSQDDSDVVIIVPSLSYKMQIPSSGITGTQFIESASTPHVTLETDDAMFTNDNSLGMGRDTSTCDQTADGRRAVHSCYGIDDEAGTSAALLEKDVSNKFQDINRPETDSTVSHMHVTGDGDYGNRECIEGSSIEETSKCLEKDLPNEQV
ncbi:hypothetical protein J437_LFUL008590 [Ladona fulva]|uniref:Potassium channel voltage dependent KCNQ C-terminal domain-containing protein n=1 Tax=Ladona fulva TaxID=123851 RepID=A0A8K0P1K4_LADFU|nr:hypothetical protein J437_LFUL008590 [Ladona fulva]